jgi:acyl-CoA thioesterase-1
VILELGGNDGLRGLSLEAMRQNLIQMTQMARKAGASVLLLGLRLPANYGRRYGERFHQVYGEVARRTGAPLVDFFLEGVAETTRLMQADGIHPSAVAQPRMLDNVWRKLRGLLSASDIRPNPTAPLPR